LTATLQCESVKGLGEETKKKLFIAAVWKRWLVRKRESRDIAKKRKENKEKDSE